MKRATRNAYGMGNVYERGGIWWIRYSHNGKRRRESSGSDKRPVAVKLLQRRQQEAGQGRPHEDVARVLLSDLKAIIEADYELQERRSGRRLAQLWRHIAAHFGEKEPAVKISA